MPLDGSGTYVPQSPEFPAIAGTTILSDDFNQIILDIAAALSATIFRDGQADFTANQSMGGFKLVNLANGVNPQDAVTVLQAFTNPKFVANAGTGVEVSGTLLTVTVTSVNLSGAGAVSLPAATTGISPAVSDNSTKMATTEFVQQVAMNSALPLQASNARKTLRTDGTNATWEWPGLEWVVVSGTGQAAVSGRAYLLTNVAATTVTLPATPGDGEVIGVKAGNSLLSNVINPNGKNIEGVAGGMTLDIPTAVYLRYFSSTADWRIV